MVFRLCIRHGLTEGYCLDCQRERGRRRGTTAQRGYGSRHQRLRNTWAPHINAGVVSCSRCGDPIAPREPWDLGHSDHDRTVYTGPEHAACNRASASRGATVTAGKGERHATSTPLVL